MGLTRHLVAKLSKFIKNYITRPFKDPLRTQAEFFQKLIRRNEVSAFGKRHHFSKIHSIRDFQKNVPILTYKEYEPYIQLILDGNPNVLTTAKQVYWGQTPGTTGKPKLLPIVNHTFRSVNLSVICMLVSYIAEDPRNNSRFLDGISCHLAAYPLLRYEGKLPVGYGTGLFSHYQGGSQIWKLFTKRRMYIPIHLNRIKDTEKRYYQLTKEIVTKDVRQFSGVPSIITNTLEKILENCPKLGISACKIRNLFPNYHLNFFGGVPPKYYESKLENLVGQKIDFREHYSATEGVLGVQLQEAPGFTPMVDANFYEFVPVKNPEDRCIINEIKKNEDYFLCISSFNGLYAYNLEDIIRFISEDPPLFIFVTRKGVVNLVDEKISRENILYAIKQANEEFNVRLNDFIVIGLRSPDLHYHFLIEFDAKSRPKSLKGYLVALDKYLQEINKTYSYFRKEIGILKNPILWILHKGSFNKVLNDRIKRGAPREQTKIPHLSDDPNDLKEFEDKVELEIIF